MWQDLALSAIGIIFTLMLIPQLLDSVRGKAILNYWTCLITGIGCLVMGCVYLTLELPISAVVSFTTGTMWLAILYYSEKNRKTAPRKYTNPHMRDIPVRDQGEYNTSVGISAATALDLTKYADLMEAFRKKEGN